MNKDYQKKTRKVAPVSPTPVREALMILGSEGSVQWEPRRGYRVVPLTTRDLHDLFSVQAFIAGELAARATTVLTGEAIDGLRKMQEDLEAAAAAGDAVRVDELNHRIHSVINACSDSRRMASLLDLTVNYMPLSFFGSIPGWTWAAAHDHDAVFDALQQRDAEAARQAMQSHIRHTGDLLVDHLVSENLLGTSQPPSSPAAERPQDPTTPTDRSSSDQEAP